MDEVKEYGIIDYYRLLSIKYKRLGINENELVVLQLIMLFDYKKIVSPKLLSEYMTISEAEIDKTLMSLIEKQIVKFYRNHFDLNKLYELLLNEEKPVTTIDKLADLIDIFAKELGKLLSPMEIDVIRTWRDMGIEDALIIEALKEAVLSQAYSIRYIDTIINNWRQRNIVSVADLERLSRL